MAERTLILTSSLIRRILPLLSGLGVKYRSLKDIPNAPGEAALIIDHENLPEGDEPLILVTSSEWHDGGLIAKQMLLPLSLAFKLVGDAHLTIVDTTGAKFACQKKGDKERVSRVDNVIRLP